MTIYTRNHLNVFKTMPDLSEYLTTEEAAKLLDFKTTSIRNMVYAGKLECRRFGRALLVSRKSVIEYYEKTKGMSKNDPRRGKDLD